MIVLMLGIMTVVGLVGVLAASLENESASEQRRLRKSNQISAPISRSGCSKPRKAA